MGTGGRIALPCCDSYLRPRSVFSADGQRHIKERVTGKADEPEKLGKRVAGLIVKQGAMEMAKGWRTAVQDWNAKL